MPAPVNFGAFGANPGEELASAVGTAAQQAPYQNAQLQQVGMQVLQPYAQKLMQDPYNVQLLTQFNRIAKMYGLPSYSAGKQGGEYGGASGGPTPGGSAQTAGAAASTPQTPGAASPQSAPATVAGAASTPAGAAPAGPGMSFGSPPSAPSSPGPDVATPGKPQTMPAANMPTVQGVAQTYQALVQQAAVKPDSLRDPSFHSNLIRAAAAAGRGPQQVKQDIAAAQEQAKMKAAHAVASRGEATPAGHAAVGSPMTSQGPVTPDQTPAAQPQGGTSAAPAPGPGETQGYMRPTSEGPLRFDTNAWLGPLSLQDFNTLSGMAPEERIEALRQQGRDINAFDPKWLHSQPSLSPAEQVTIAHDAATAIGNDIRDGATPDQVKLSVATYRPYLTPAQNAELDSNIKDQLDGSLRIRQTQVASTGFLRQQTLNLMTRKLADSEKNVAWDHDYRYTVLDDKNSQWSAQQSVRQQNATTSAQRLQLEFSKAQSAGEIDANGRPIKGQGGIKPGEMINTARGLLTSIGSAVNEYNTRLQNALQNPGKGGGVNAPMEADIQNQIDAYNQIVDQMDARGMHYFKHYTGPDQAAMAANTAAQTAGTAVQAQGQNPGQASKPARIVQQNSRGQYRHSDDGGKTWQPGP